MLSLLIATAVLSALLPSLVAAVPLIFRPFNTTSCIEATGLRILARNESATLAESPRPTHAINGAAGTEMTPELIGAIVGGAVGIALLVTLLLWCGRKGRW
ncbi:uncharacterized protein PG998_010559 [Apiospora kogelbergensis]|uniref:uncharacterized protein n=1 Tax=Apiospora kogelbergensis TaxID=1337665 RepID=UPI003132368A